MDDLAVKQTDAMNLKELKRLCDRLSLNDMTELRDYLSNAIISSPERMKSPLRGSILLGEMASLLGVQSISYVSRKPIEVWARAMVAYQMLREGYTTLEVGHQILKDHSSVTHLKNKMEDALSLPQVYGDILEIWTNFQKQIQ